jgi:hypothetical protein
MNSKENQMPDYNWKAPAKLLERQDAGSDMYIGFTQLKEGTLSSLISDVAAMIPAERARLVIDAAEQGTFAVGEILNLAAREDFTV